jgi:hypothetical protein
MTITPSSLDRAVYWRAMSALQRHHGSFTLRIIVDIVGAEHRKRVVNYLDILVDERVVSYESEPARGGLVTYHYRIINLGEVPPIRPRDKGARQRALWTAMRSLKNFSEAELAVAAATEDLPIGRDAAAAYIGELAAAGFITVAGVAPTRFATPSYRLQPSHNTGPRAPIVLVADSVAFDLNLMRSVNLNSSGRAA